MQKLKGLHELTDTNSDQQDKGLQAKLVIDRDTASRLLTNGAAVGTNGNDTVRDRIGKLSWTWVPSSSVVNELRFGWFKDRQADDFNPDLQAGYPIGNVSLSVAGVSTLGGYNILPRMSLTSPTKRR